MYRPCAPVGIRVNLDLAVNQVDDPVDRDPSVGIGKQFLGPIPGQAALGNLDDEGDVTRAGMMVRVGGVCASDHGDIGLRLIIVWNANRVFLGNVPTRGEKVLERAAGILSWTSRASVLWASYAPQSHSEVRPDHLH